MPKWNSEDLAYIVKRCNSILRLTTDPVGITLFEQTDEAEALIQTSGGTVNRVNKRMSLCQFVGQSRYLNRVHVGSAEQLSLCPPGAVAMGFMPLPEWYPHAYVGQYFTEYAISERVLREMPSLPIGQYQAMLAAPLHSMPIDPDVVLFFGNSHQIYHLVMAHAWDTGERLTFTACGEFWGADAIAAPILTGKPHLAFFCQGGRILANPNDTDISMGVPADQLDHMVQGLEFQSTGVPYPIKWLHVGWDVQDQYVLDIWTPPVQPESRT